MAGSLRLISRYWLKMVKPVSETTSVRSISVTATISADKKPAQGSKTATPSKPAAASKASTGGESYQVPEYYQYNEMSYYQMESDMRKGRLPQPKPGQPSD
ncbi:uncharacterized protein LOC121419073 [Lytechinus variegatus]|uniref:uncharacterized protein LOC121419073 n=1 Tax=Lytechinus variegatus TaxID=7654 RepID=UPI001BB0E110|nr:uncharacterized protein LOC121419073 [Lytechinus variegatus]